MEGWFLFSHPFCLPVDKIYIHCVYSSASFWGTLYIMENLKRQILHGLDYHIFYQQFFLILMFQLETILFPNWKIIPHLWLMKAYKERDLKLKYLCDQINTHQWPNDWKDEGRREECIFQFSMHLNRLHGQICEDLEAELELLNQILNAHVQNSRHNLNSVLHFVVQWWQIINPISINSIDLLESFWLQ